MSCKLVEKSDYSRKKSISITPSTFGDGLHNPPNLWNGLYHLLNFPKPIKLSPKSVLKNHSKSQKNHKMKNPIVLDSKWVELHSEHIIWYALVHFFYNYKEKHRSKATAKKNTKAYHIICSLCRSTHLKSNIIRFSILWFFLWFTMIFQNWFRGNLTGFEKFRGWYKPFYRLGVM